MSSAPAMYAFLDTRQGGAYPVFDEQGAVAARIDPAFLTRKFTAYASDDSVLCTGTGVPLSRAFDVLDGDGRPLLTLRSAPLSGKRRTVTLSSGSELEVRGDPWPSRDWTVVDAQGRPVLSIVPTAGGWSFHPDAYAVRVADPALTLAHVVGVVQANRMLIKAARRRSHGGAT